MWKLYVLVLCSYYQETLFEDTEIDSKSTYLAPVLQVHDTYQYLVLANFHVVFTTELHPMAEGPFHQSTDADRFPLHTKRDRQSPLKWYCT